MPRRDFVLVVDAHGYAYVGKQRDGFECVLPTRCPMQVMIEKSVP